MLMVRTIKAVSGNERSIMMLLELDRKKMLFFFSLNMFTVKLSLIYESNFAFFLNCDL